MEPHNEEGPTATGFPIMSVGTADAGPEAEQEMDGRAGGGGGAVTTVDVVVLTPTEKGHAAKIDPVVEETVARLAAARRPVVVLGVAPPYPLAVRLLPGGIARQNRESDATALDRRCSAIRDSVRERDASAVVTVHVVAQGTADVAAMAVEGAAAAARECAAPGRRAVIGHVAVPPDSATMMGSTNAEVIVRAVLAARSDKDTDAFTAHTTAEMLRDPNATLPRGRRTRPGVAVCIVDTEALGAFPPPHVAGVLARALDGDEVLLVAPIPLPEASEATQLTSVDWSTKLKDLEATARRILDDHVAHARRILERRGVKATVGSAVSSRHYMQAIDDVVKVYAPRCVAVAEEFRRQRALRTVWEAVRGAEYERIARANPATGLSVA
eukprot:CAMPEP_0174853316 /NCGR_PEP_ID=MMETSP1114-20130205/27906_1 /TAXON_ID=312471 /ORGANISM="Neobodo designis, Strain CCAP 1951/1" /LENGTH=383 /DNA_ID=CAMNT_0016087951 /DNA_START=129 /DNA_END=1280 /DNA_ORIENTATION=+